MNSPLLLTNIKDWGEFTIGDFFTVKRGKRIVRDRDYFSIKTDEYPYNVITSTKQNNGVDGFYHSYNCPANSLVCGGEAGGLYTTYQPKECWVMDRARIFTPKNHLQLNKYIALFLATVFSQNQYKYSYGRTPNPDGIESTVIKLPITLQGKPDWDYMMKYIKSLGAEPITTSIKKDALLSMSTEDWKWFRVGDFFIVRRGKRIVRDIDYFTEKTAEYHYKVITATTQNNGVDGFYHSYNCPANSLVCGGDAAGMFTTYQSNECWVMDSARIVTPQKDISFNKYSALFISTLLNQNQYMYSYGRKCNKENIENTLIKLPTTPDGTPDWEYMENYIKSLPYSDRI